MVKDVEHLFMCLLAFGELSIQILCAFLNLLFRDFPGSPVLRTSPSVGGGGGEFDPWLGS